MLYAQIRSTYLLAYGKIITEHDGISLNHNYTVHV